MTSRDNRPSGGGPLSSNDFDRRSVRGAAESAPPAEAAHQAAPQAVGSQERPTTSAKTDGCRFEPQPGTHKVQAAHVSDETSTHDALAGGKCSPRPPASARPRSKKLRVEAGRLSFRADDETVAYIEERMALAGCNISQAIVQLIKQGAGVEMTVIAPRTPPEQLEWFVGALRAWRRDFLQVRSRLNAPMPRDGDEELVRQIRTWRKTAERLLVMINDLIEPAEALSRLLTSLTPDRVKRLRELYPLTQGWVAREKEKAETSNNRAHLVPMMAYQAIAELIEDLGIAQKEE